MLKTAMKSNLLEQHNNAIATNLNKMIIKQIRPLKNRASLISTSVKGGRVDELSKRGSVKLKIRD